MKSARTLITICLLFTAVTLFSQTTPSQRLMIHPVRLRWTVHFWPDTMITNLSKSHYGEDPPAVVLSCHA